MNENIRTVKYFASQSAEDLYRCDETGCVYIRQTCDDEYVRWLTANKWQGGYEADCPMKKNIVIHAVDRLGNLLFREELVVVDGYMDTVAKKVGPFSWEAINALAGEIATRFGLTGYYDWKEWVMADTEKFGYIGYYENWLYDADFGKIEKIAKMDFLGVSVYAIKQPVKHKVSGKEWVDYEIRTVDLSACVAICGYELKKEDAE